MSAPPFRITRSEFEKLPQYNFTCPTVHLVKDGTGGGRLEGVTLWKAQNQGKSFIGQIVIQPTYCGPAKRTHWYTPEIVDDPRPQPQPARPRWCPEED
jgi:hypothetical protein